MRKYLIFIYLFIVYQACITVMPTTTPKQNIAMSYNPGSSILHPEFMVYHYGDSTSAVFVKFFTEELIFSEANEKNQLMAHVKVNYQLMNPAKNYGILDTASFVVKIDGKTTRSYYVHRFNIPAKKGRKYALKVVINDLIRDIPATNYINIDKSSDFDRQNFYLMQRPMMKPPFRYYFSSKDTCVIQSRFGNSIHQYFIDIYKKRIPLPPPPFSEVTVDSLRIQPDTSLVFNSSGSLELALQEKGMYQIRVDTAHKEGLTLFHFNDYYPQLKTPAQLLGPLQYITSRKDFEAISSAKDLKLAVDNFWLKITGNKERARELIRVFYNRVTYANYYFTAYTEGWRTDRGMIYIIFGPPSNVTKANNRETWTYGSQSNAFKMLVFNFNHQKSPFSDNHYVLERNAAYQPSWYKAVESWKNGQVYTEGK
jgi:GWxTD domain-containing protein